MQQYFKTIYSRVFSKPFENFEIFKDGVKYTYQDFTFIVFRNHRIILSFFVDQKMIDDYYRNMMHRYCPCKRFFNLYRINPHAKSFMRIEPNFLQFIMPYFYLYLQSKYSRYWLHYYNLTYSIIPYDNYYLKFLLCVLM